jgi:DNA-binding NtrC family response regulator
MSTGTEFSNRRPQAEEARVDERFVRVLFVETRSDLADEICGSLGRAGCGSFDIVQESSLVSAAAQIQGETFDLLLLDPALPDVDREAAIELASDLAHRLPVVVLTGTEAYPAPDLSRASALRPRLKGCIERADLPGKLLGAIRRARRFGTGVMAPIFCRIEGIQS